MTEEGKLYPKYERPGCVTGYAILLGIGASFSALIGLIVIFNDPRGFVYTMKLSTDERFALSYFWGSALILFSFAWGLWRLKDWARVGIIIFLILGIFFVAILNPIGLVIQLPVAGYLIYWFTSNDKYFEGMEARDFKHLFQFLLLLMIIAVTGFSITWGFIAGTQTLKERRLSQKATVTAQALSVQKNATATQEAADARALVRKFAERGLMISVSFSLDGNRIVTGSKRGEAYIWDVSSGEKIANLGKYGKSNDVRAIYSPDGLEIITLGQDQRGASLAIIWDAQTGQELLTLTDVASRLKMIYSPDGKRIVISNRAHFPTIWDVHTGKQIAVLAHEQPFNIATIAYSPDGKTILTAETEVKVWDAHTGQRITEFGGSNSTKIYNVAYNPDGQSVLVIKEDGVATIWDTGTQKSKLTIGEPSDALYSALYSPDGHYIVTTSINKVVKVWDTRTGQEITTLNHPNRVISIAYSPDGKKLATVASRTTYIWDATVLHEGGVFNAD